MKVMKVGIQEIYSRPRGWGINLIFQKLAQQTRKSIENKCRLKYLATLLSYIIQELGNAIKFQDRWCFSKKRKAYDATYSEYLSAPECTQNVLHPIHHVLGEAFGRACKLR